MTNIQQGFYEKLRAARKNAHLTQNDMAAKLSITRSAYTYYETGRVLPDLDCFARICRILGVSADSMLGIG